VQSADRARLGCGLRNKKTNECVSGKLVYQLIAIKRVLVTRTSQLVVADQVELKERSQLAELGWDAT